MRALALKSFVVLVALVAACSGDNGGSKSNSLSNNDPANVQPNNLPSNAEVCADDVQFCETARCRMCRYEREVVTDAGEWPVMRMGTAPVIAYFDDSSDELKLARRNTPGTWDIETAWTAVNGWEEGSIQLALTTDGEAWMTIADQDRAVTVVFEDAAGWQAEPIEGVFDSAPIAVDADDVPWIVHGPLTGGLALAGRVDGAWRHTVLDDSTEFINARTILAADGGIWVAWVHRAAAELRVGFWDGSTFDSEVAMTNVGSNLRPLSLSLASDGELLGVTANDRVAIRRDGQWSATNTAANGDNNVLLLGANGPRHVGYEFFGLAVSQQVGDAWPSQLISTDCDSEALDAAYGPAGELFIAYWCNSEIVFMEHTGLYDSGYSAACRALTTALCDAALECNPDASDVSGDLCLFGNGGTNCINVPYCETDFYGAVCGDATQDPSLVTTCADANPSECRNEAEDGGVVLPEACAFR